MQGWSWSKQKWNAIYACRPRTQDPWSGCWTRLISTSQALLNATAYHDRGPRPHWPPAETFRESAHRALYDHNEACLPGVRSAAVRTPRSRFICNLEDLAQLVFERYGSHHPIATVQLDYPSSTYLVLLGGTELLLGQTTRIADDIAAFRSNPALQSSYAQAIMAALRASVPPGSNLIIAGHSLGGMEAQNVIASHAFAASPYRAIRVITYGSPQTAPEQSGVDYVRVDAAADLVPALGPLQFQAHLAIMIPGAGVDPYSNHMVYQNSAYLGRFEVTGRSASGSARSRAIDQRTGRATPRCLELNMQSLRQFR